MDTDFVLCHTVAEIAWIFIQWKNLFIFFKSSSCYHTQYWFCWIHSIRMIVCLYWQILIIFLSMPFSSHVWTAAVHCLHAPGSSRPQLVENAAAHILTPSIGPISPLYWLPVKFQNYLKNLLITFRAQHGGITGYISELLTLLWVLGGGRYLRVTRLFLSGPRGSGTRCLRKLDVPTLF